MRKPKAESSIQVAVVDRTMDSREIAAVIGKQHKHVIRDIETMLEQITELKSGSVNEPKSGPVKFEASYIDGKGETRKCYKLPYRETMILVSGYSVELRAAVVDRWIKLEKAEKKRVIEQKESRRKATETRNFFTDVLKDHGCMKPGHYIQITQAMKGALGIPMKLKKKDFGRRELLRTMAAEALAALNIEVNDANGYIECRKESERASDTVALSAVSISGELNG